MLRRMLAALAVIPLVASAAGAITLRTYPTPPRTTWKPTGCRSVPVDDPVLGDRTAYRNLRPDPWNSAEVTLAHAAVLSPGWTAEPGLWIPTGPTFDRQGNVYVSPLWPADGALIVSLDPTTGARRWSVPGGGASGCAPFVTNDPDVPGEDVIFAASYEEFVAVRADGTERWRVPTGLVAGPTAQGADLTNFGVNYVPQADAVISNTGDGHLVVHDRATGVARLAAPFSLPGERAAALPPSAVPPAVVPAIDAILLPLLPGAPAGTSFESLRQTLLGGNTENANFFSVDPHTGRIWTAATAPDGDDGTVDGVSQNGALYALDLDTTGGPPWTLVEHCRATFTGGTAATPSLRADGTRVYTADATTHVLAIDAATCAVVWSIDVGGQVNASVGVASDGGELYANTQTGLVKLFDRGDHAEIAWTAQIDAWQADPGDPAGLVGVSILPASIGASSVLVQVGYGFVFNQTVVPVRVGYADVDRDTGHIRAITEGPEESVAVSVSGRDGEAWVANSPIRRAVSLVLFGAAVPGQAPLTGGVTRFGIGRRDVLLRDAACAAADRAVNAKAEQLVCPDAAAADLRQLGDLADQLHRTLDPALAAGDVTAPEYVKLSRQVGRARDALALASPKRAARRFATMCRYLDRRVVPD